MPFNHEPSVTEDGNRGNLHQEADKLLKLAEELQEKCEDYERRMLVSYFIAGSLTLTLLGIGALLVVFPLAESVWNYVLVVLAFLYALATGGFLFFQGLRFRRLIDRDRRALYGVVDMLRELEQGIAKENNLSALERAEFRIRLSRFDIGPGYHRALEKWP